MKQTTVFGPPGTGKTTRLIRYLTELLTSGLRADDVCYTSFTRVAADVAKVKAIVDAGADEDDLEWFGTLHSLCGRLLDFDWRSRLLSENTEKGKQLYKQFGRDEGFTFDFSGDADVEADAFTGALPEGNQLLAWWNWAQQCGLDVEAAITRWRSISTAMLVPERQRQFVRVYHDFKADLGVSDFTDILVMADKRNLTPPVRALFVDECQDLSPIQWRILDRWAARAERVYFGGDDDQAIYAWQGADAALFLDRSDVGAMTTLEQSYRLPRSSWALSTWLSKHIKVRKDKPFAPMQNAGVCLERPLFRLPFAETNGSWFVLARNAFLLAPARAHLEDMGLPYTSKRGFDPSKIYYPAARAITALARHQGINREDLGQLVRRLEPGRDFDPFLARRLSRNRLRELPLVISQHDLEGLGFADSFRERLVKEPIPARMLTIKSAKGFTLGRTWNYLVRLQRDHGDNVFNTPPNIVLSTIHGVKGDEADNVALLTDMAKASVRTLDTDPDSEHRVWYVGASRAKKNLYVVPPSTDTHYPLLVSGGWKSSVVAVAG